VTFPAAGLVPEAAHAAAEQLLKYGIAISTLYYTSAAGENVRKTRVRWACVDSTIRTASGCTAI
jgi:hypothetical protein